MLVSSKAMEKLKDLGERLRGERLRRNESQHIFAARIGTSIPTLLKMENGDINVKFGYWIAALDILDHLSDLDQLLAPPEYLFEKYERTKKPQRQRASRKRE